MSTIGQNERRTQDRVVRLFRDTLGYDYLGDLSNQTGNSNIDAGLLRAWLQSRGVGDELISRALYILEKTAGATSKSLYDRNHEVYTLLRYGVDVKAEASENKQQVHFIDWEHPEANHFAIAEEVTVRGSGPASHDKRPDVVLYVNGIALAVLELKRSRTSVSEGIRQGLDNQKPVFIEHFFSTVQFVLAGNDTQGLRYAAIQTPEKHYLTWKEPGAEENPLDRGLTQLFGKTRFLELIHDFVVFDAGTKKLCRHNQYFGVRAAQEYVARGEGGIMWHTQGSGKSLTMVWLTKWIRENVKDARVLIITDRTELDEQIEKVFLGVQEKIYRTTSGEDLIAKLNTSTEWLICSLIHKFGRRENGEEVGDISGYIDEVKKALPHDFSPKGKLYVFVDECHRTQSGDLHRAMKTILPDAVFIGFTGTPLLKDDKQRSIEIFGRYIHTYRFDEAVRDGVVLDLRYEARDIDQDLTSPNKVDQWFDLKTRGLTDLARAQLKSRWGTMKKVLSSQSRLEQIVDDILMDMELRDRLKSGRGNAMLVSGSIYQACKLYELFAGTDLANRCAIVTSYKPSPADIKGEESGEGLTERLRQYGIYRRMLADWFKEPPETAMYRVEEFEKEVKKKFIEEPGQMKLLIVVDKLLTGFDAPPATFLYIDKQMRDHGLFQAICRVNRLDGDDKEYGYIIDYKDLFHSLKGAVADYTSGALDGYDRDDVAGLLEDRLTKARERLDDALEAIRGLCEPVDPPRDDHAFYRYFSSAEHGDAGQLKENEPRRLTLYTMTAALIRAYANVADEMVEAGYTRDEAQAIRAEVTFYEQLRSQVKLHSGDAIDLKLYEPAMRHLIDSYIRAEPSREVSALEDLSLVQLIVQRGAAAVEAFPEGIRTDPGAMAETIENNVRKLIIDETPINPKYYEKMSQLLDALIAERKREAVEYEVYLRRIVELTKAAANPESATAYPATMNTPGKRALYDNLDGNEALAAAIDAAVRASRQDDWRSNMFKVRRVRNAIRTAVEGAMRDPSRPSVSRERPLAGYVGRAETLDERLDRIIELVKNQNEY